MKDTTQETDMEYTTRLDQTTETELEGILEASGQPNAWTVTTAEANLYRLIKFVDYEGDKIYAIRTKVDHIDHVMVWWKKEYRS